MEPEEERGNLARRHVLIGALQAQSVKGGHMTLPSKNVIYIKPQVVDGNMTRLFGELDSVATQEAN